RGIGFRSCRYSLRTTGSESSPTTFGPHEAEGLFPHRSSIEENAAAEVVRLAGDHAGLGAGEIDGERGDVFGFEAAADRGHAAFDFLESDAAALGVVLQPPVVHHRMDRSRADGVD